MVRKSLLLRLRDDRGFEEVAGGSLSSKAGSVTGRSLKPRLALPADEGGRSDGRLRILELGTPRSLLDMPRP